MSQAKRTALPGYLLALTATIIWSFNFIVARLLAHDVPPITMSFLRWSTAFIAVLPFGIKHLRRDLPALRQHWRYVCATALLGISLFNAMIYLAGHTTQALNMALIATSSPVFIVILSRIFLGEPITHRRAAGVLLAVCGVVVLVTRGDLAALTRLTFASGDLWMLAAALTFAAYSVLARRRPPTIAPLSFLTATFGIGLVGILPMLPVEYALGYHLTGITPLIIGCVLYMGVGASLISFFCWNGAVERIGPVKAALVYYSLPLFSGMEALLLLGEAATLAHLAGGILVVGGILTATMEWKKHT